MRVVYAECMNASYETFVAGQEESGCVLVFVDVHTVCKPAIVLSQHRKWHVAQSSIQN